MSYQICVSVFLSSLYLLCVLVCFEGALIGLVEIVVVALGGCSLNRLVMVFTHELIVSCVSVPVHGGFSPFSGCSKTCLLYTSDAADE